MSHRDPEIDFLVEISPEPITDDGGPVFLYLGESYSDWAYRRLSSKYPRPSEEHERDIKATGETIFLPVLHPATSFHSVYEYRLEIDRPDNYDTPHP